MESIKVTTTIKGPEDWALVFTIIEHGWPRVFTIDPKNACLDYLENLGAYRGTVPKNPTSEKDYLWVTESSTGDILVVFISAHMKMIHICPVERLSGKVLEALNEVYRYKQKVLFGQA